MFFVKFLNHFQHCRPKSAHDKRAESTQGRGQWWAESTQRNVTTPINIARVIVGDSFENHQRALKTRWGWS